MIELNRIAFTIFGIDVYYYGLIMAGAILGCLIVAIILCKVKKIETMQPIELFLSIVPSGIIGARLFSIIFEKSLTITDFFDFRSGGMSIMGALIGGALGLLIYTLITKKSFLMLADIITSVLLLGQSIGRWGNYFNKEVYGQEIVKESLQFFPFGVQINGTWYEALFFWESVLSILGFIILLIVYIKTSKKGLVTGIYLLYYGTIRVILESRRQSEYILAIGNLQVSSLVSVLLIVSGIAIITYIVIKNLKGKKENSFGRKKVHK